MRSKIVFLINGSAGRVADNASRQKLTGMTAQAFAEAEVIVTDGGGELARLAQRAIDRGSTMVVAGGGDGTINAVASAVAGTTTVLGVLPLGTLNHFAKDAGIPLNIESALQTLRAGHVALVDVGQVNERIFLNNSGLGLYPDIVFLREAEQKRGIAKWPAALWAALVELSPYRLLVVRVRVDGRELLLKAPIVFVGNNEYEFAGVGLPTRTRLDAGRLCLYIPPAEGELRLLWFAVRAWLGTLRLGNDFDGLLTEAFSIHSRQRLLRISIDGEVDQMATPLNFRIRPRALRVAVPTPTA